MSRNRTYYHQEAEWEVCSSAHLLAVRSLIFIYCVFLISTSSCEKYLAAFNNACCHLLFCAELDSPGQILPDKSSEPKAKMAEKQSEELKESVIDALNKNLFIRAGFSQDTRPVDG